MQTNSKKPTALEMSRIKAAFSTLEKGDIIRGEDEKAFLVIRMIEGKGAVLGDICPCGKHLNQVVNTTYSWSDEKQALVNGMGEISKIWSYDLSVHRGEGLALADEYAHIPVNADYYTELPVAGEISAMVERNEKIIAICADVLFEASEIVAMRRVLELIGVEASEEQALILSVAVSGAQALRKERAFDGAVVLGIVRGGPGDQNQMGGATKH